MMGEKSDENSVSVVHLIWPPLGQEVFNNFILSYCKHKDGYPHELVLLCNGVSNKEQISSYIQFIEEKNISYKLLFQPHPWQDLDAYFWAAGQLQSEYIL